MSRNQAINAKFNSLSKQSGEVTAALSALEAPSAKDAYTRIQRTEAASVAAVTAEQNAIAASEHADAAVEAARRNLRLLNAACVDICAAQNIVSAQHFTIMDKGDDTGLASHLEPELRRVPGYGPGLADAVNHLMGALRAAKADAQRAQTLRTTSMRELDSAMLTLQAVVAQGRAVLATFGVKLTRKTKKKSAVAPAEPATSPVSLAPAA